MNDVNNQEQESKFAYNSPVQLMGIVEYLVKNAASLENTHDNSERDIVLYSKCNFIVMCAAAIEAHLNWYYHFHLDIDVTERDEKGRIKHTIESKIKNAPIGINSKGECKAIFKLRNQMVHPKYEPRDPCNQYPYDLYFMYLSFNTLASLAKTLLQHCPETLGNRLGLTEAQSKLADLAAVVSIKNESGQKINWAEAVNTDRVGLPMINIFHFGT